MANNSRSLVTIETITAVHKHPDANTLWVVRVQGWDVVINAQAMFGSENPDDILGQTVVYFQIDSVLPEKFNVIPNWKYLSQSHMGKKIKSTKLRGVVSQGMILSVADIAAIFPDINWGEMAPGANVTELINVTQYYDKSDPDAPQSMRQAPAGCAAFPEFLEKTGQTRLQEKIGILQNLDSSRLFTATVKYDGQSVQWFNNKGRVGVCSRNFEVNIDVDSSATQNFKEMNDHYDILNKLRAFGRNMAIQAEMYGPKINGNRHKLEHVDLAVYAIYDIDNRVYLPFSEVVEVSKVFNLSLVTTVFENKPLISTEIDHWIELANQQRYSDNLRAEGIVVCSSDGKQPRVSFKVISPEYLIEHKL